MYVEYEKALGLGPHLIKTSEEHVVLDVFSVVETATTTNDRK